MNTEIENDGWEKDALEGLRAFKALPLRSKFQAIQDLTETMTYMLERAALRKQNSRQKSLLPNSSLSS